MGDEWEVESDAEGPIDSVFSNIDGGHKYKIRNKKTGERKILYVNSWQKIGEAIENGQVEDDDSGRGFCYITTACVKSLNLPDDCFELRLLRKFRDSILMQEPMGRRAVREYYRIAPEIVKSIREREDSSKIWKNIYDDINKAVRLILSKDYNGAFEQYKATTLRLKERYLK